MTSSLERIPVFVVEDYGPHAEQIRQTLERANYAVAVSHTGSRVELYSYKAKHQSSQIVIADLDLGFSQEVDPQQGLDLIIDHIWPYDRTTLFVIFSAYIDSKAFAASSTIRPHWCCVKKICEPGSRELMPSCLDELLAVVGACAQVISPDFPTPHFDSYGYLRALTGPSGVPARYTRQIEECIVRSVSLLNQLALAAVPFERAGSATRGLGLGVYGSCGRLEMREDSDVEFSVFYSNASSEVVDRRLVASLWTRLAYHISGMGVPMEGSGILKIEPFVLLETQVGEELRNRYHAVLCAESVIKADLDKEPHQRDRHFQILTELRPIFNPAFLTDMKRSMIKTQMGPVEDLEGFVDKPYMERISAQYMMDTQPDDLGEWATVKKLCYRIINVLALRLGLIGRLQFAQDSTLRTDVAWANLFEWLMLPGILKVLQFERECKESRPKLRTSDGVTKVVTTYEILMGRLAQKTGDKGAVREICRDAIVAFDELFRHLRKQAAFAASSRNAWLFSSGDIASRVEKW